MVAKYPRCQHTILQLCYSPLRTGRHNVNPRIFVSIRRRGRFPAHFVGFRSSPPPPAAASPAAFLCSSTCFSSLSFSNFAFPLAVAPPPVQHSIGNHSLHGAGRVSSSSSSSSSSNSSHTFKFKTTPFCRTRFYHLPAFIFPFLFSF